VVYIWNANYMSLYFHSMANFAFTGFESLLPTYQLGYIGAVVTLLELVLAKPRTTARVGTIGNTGTQFTFAII
jgi:hypothetical protein